jgi:hypothetical protein
MPITFTATTLSFSLPGLMGSNPGQNWIVLWGVITNCAISYFYSKNFVTFMPQSYEKRLTLKSNYGELTQNDHK